MQTEYLLTIFNSFSSFKEDVDDDFSALADSLLRAFSDRSNMTKKEIAQTLVPAYNDVKRAIELLDENLEPPFARAMIQFSNGCKSTEAAFSRQAELEDAYIALKVSSYI